MLLLPSDWKEQCTESKTAYIQNKVGNGNELQDLNLESI
jgi:hypothetical protein